MRFFAETFGNQDFFLLAGAEIRDVFVKLNPREIKLTQASFEDRFIDSVFSGKVGQTAAEMGGILRYIRYFELTGFVKNTGIGDWITANQFEKAGLSRAVLAA